jgi:hypothetical protein
MLSNQLLKAANETMQHFADQSRWVLLLGQMQSGKTATYLFIACEMLRLRKVETVTIFSGNSEILLKEKTLEDMAISSPFFRAYGQYLQETHYKGSNSFVDITSLLTKISKRMTLVWGAELGKKVVPYEYALFIWDESHFAQSLRQRPDFFLTKMGISPDGDVKSIAAKRNYVISISATPFSELSDIHHFRQSKAIVFREPAPGYHGVKAKMEEGLIRPYGVLMGGLSQALRYQKELNYKTYSIIRVTIKTAHTVRSVCHNYGLIVVEFDSSTSGKSGKNVWDKMGRAPEQNTVILIKELCRMGQAINKKHVSFFLETVEKADANTILQSFIGRACGYSPGSDRVAIYINSMVYDSDAITTFIKMWDTKTIILPSRATNFASSSAKAASSSFIINIPIIIRGGARFIKNFKKKENRDKLVDDVIDLLESGDRDIIVSNLNNEVLTQSIIDSLSFVDFEEIKEQVQALKLSAERYRKTKVSERMVQSLTECRPCESLGFSHAKPYVFWLVDEDSQTEWYQAGDLLLTCLLKDEDDVSREKPVPNTNGKEVFRKNIITTTTTTTTMRRTRTIARMVEREREPEFQEFREFQKPIIEDKIEEEPCLSKEAKTCDETLFSELAHIIHANRVRSVKRFEGPAFVDFKIFRLLVPLPDTPRSCITDQEGFGTIAFMIKERFGIDLIVSHGGTMYRKEGDSFIETIEIKSISW